ncbi:invasion protein CiaB [Candidatus Gracilibacteria bacterium]|nr:invasion protein CiaB [Candidatus Gracilibacteria bacterium]
MNKDQFLKNISKIQDIFSKQQEHLNTLSNGINSEGPEREILDSFLDELGLEKNTETRYIASARMGDKKFEPLQIYLEKQGKTQTEQDVFFEKSYKFVQKYYEDLQETMLQEIREQKLLTDFYLCIFDYTHKLGNLYSDLFLKWNTHLQQQNRNLEQKFENDTDKILEYLEENKLFDLGHNGEKADRSYSLLREEDGKLVSRAYSEMFPEEVKNICELYNEFIEKLQKLDDEVYNKKEEYIAYFQAIIQAWQERDVHKLVEKWTQVDRTWMKIDTPVQPGHMMEYYEDKYRKAVSVEFDLRLDDSSLFTSEVHSDIHSMYETMYDEIGRENFSESYKFSLENQKKVQLHIGTPILQYAAFLCGAYSAQVVPNDDIVSQAHGKKIFAFPKFVLESKRLAPKMKLDTEIFSSEILEKYENFLQGDDENFYKIYDIETIGHEFGHTLWLTPGCEVKMNDSGQFKNIEEFKATAGGLVAYFFSGKTEFSEDILIDHIMRSVKIMRYREVEDILPYYCECLIHLDILFESKIIDFTNGKIELEYTDENFENLKTLYTATYTQQIFTYLNQMDATNFLYEFVIQENGVFLPKDREIRKFVEIYYKLYKKIGNEIA